MAGTGPEFERIRRLADEVRAKILAEIEVLARSRGKISIECHPKKETFDINLTPTI
jgi:hypothetical protein